MRPVWRVFVLEPHGNEPAETPAPSNFVVFGPEREAASGIQSLTHVSRAEHKERRPGSLCDYARVGRRAEGLADPTEPALQEARTEDSFAVESRDAPTGERRIADLSVGIQQHDAFVLERPEEPIERDPVRATRGEHDVGTGLAGKLMKRRVLSVRRVAVDNEHRNIRKRPSRADHGQAEASSVWTLMMTIRACPGCTGSRA
jgi:hypothetical protein